jgi:hypothetical protein
MINPQRRGSEYFFGIKTLRERALHRSPLNHTPRAQHIEHLASENSAESLSENRLREGDSPRRFSDRL